VNHVTPKQLTEAEPRTNSVDFVFNRSTKIYHQQHAKNVIRNMFTVFALFTEVLRCRKEFLAHVGLTMHIWVARRLRAAPKLSEEAEMLKVAQQLTTVNNS